MSYEPQIGHFLHASCSDTVVYEIIGSGKDACDQPTIDVRVLDINAILHFENEDRAPGPGAKDEGGYPIWFNPFTRGELPDGIYLILREMQWQQAPKEEKGERVTVVVNAPVGGCYRCCYMFGVYSDKEGRIPVLEETGHE